MPATVSQAFNLAGSRGIGSFAINPLTPLNSFNLGQIVLTYNVFDADPNNPAANLLQVDQVGSTNAEIFATDTPPDLTPEPATFFTAFTALAFVVFRVRRS